jgi:hypothetical protein
MVVRILMHPQSTWFAFALGAIFGWVVSRALA